MGIQKFVLPLTLAIAGAVSTSVAHARGPLPDVDVNTRFIIYYGNEYYSNTNAAASQWIINTDLVDDLAAFDVVVLQPNQPNFTAEIIEELKDKNPDIITLGYISIGEDFVDDAIESPLGNGTGMVTYDASLNDLVPTANNTLQSFYVDVDTQTVTRNEFGTVTKVVTPEGGRLNPDGKPDYNPSFLGYMVNPDNNWRWVIDNMRIGSNDVQGHSTKAGLKQLAGVRDVNDLRNRSADFGFDGFFLDTIDTSAPFNSAGYYPWSVDEMRDTVKYISDTYQDKIVFANRGAFYFTAGLKSPVTDEYSIDFSLRTHINAFLFESFRYDSQPDVGEKNGVSEFYNENRYNVLPKVMAQASGQDGFTVFALEYESGRVVNGTDLANDAFNTDIHELGFVSYLAVNGDLNDVGLSFFNLLPEFDLEDTVAPVWDTTATVAFNTVSETSRIGAQGVSMNETNGGLRVEWDIALDQSLPITYDIVVTDASTLVREYHENVAFEPVEAWLHDPVSNSAYAFTIDGLSADKSYTVQVIAVDAKGNRNTDDPGMTYVPRRPTAITSNALSAAISIDGDLSEWDILQAYPNDPADDVVGQSVEGHESGPGNQANWTGLQIAHTESTLYMAYKNATNLYISSGFQLFIDSDNNPETGFSGGFGDLTDLPIGADFLIEGINVHQYAGTGDDWSWVSSPNSEGFQIGRAWSGAEGEVEIPLHWIGSPSESFTFIAFGNNKYYSGEEEFDWFPDNAIDGGFFRYDF